MTRTSSFFSYTFLTNQRHLKSRQFLPLQLISNISKQNKNKKGTKSTRNTPRYRERWKATRTRSSGSEALARASAKGSQFWVSIPPLGSAIFTPLSETLLWEAVIINPITDLVFSDLRAANIPTLYTVDSKIDASALNPAVP